MKPTPILLCIFFLHVLLGGVLGWAQPLAIGNAKRSSDWKYRGILFDFRWSEQLHSFFDAKDAGDLIEAEAVLRKWEESEKDASFENKASCAQLISLLKLDDKSLGTNLHKKATNQSTSWELLLALEQIDLRLGSPRPDHRKEIEEVIKNRCERFLIAYLKQAYTTKQISTVVCQAVSRLRDDRVALKLLEQASEAIESRGAPTNLPIAILESERLVSLATSDVTFRNRAYSSLKRVCELLEIDEDHREAHPLALAKNRRSLATLESAEERKIELLALALNDLPNVEFSNSVPDRWLWDAGRALKNAAGLKELQQANMLLEYRRETLKAALLLDGYTLLSKRTKKQKLTKPTQPSELFDAAKVETSLKAVTQLQKNFKVAKVDQLRTLFSLATIQAAVNSRDSQETLNDVMTIAWSLKDDHNLDDSSRRLVYECQLAWIESRVKNGDLGPKPQPLLPSDPAEAVKSLEADENFEQQVDQFKRLRKSQLAITLARDSLKDANFLLDRSRKTETLEPLLLDSFELLLATRTSNQRKAELHRDIVECLLDAETDLETKLFPLYALSEFYVENGVSASDALGIRHILNLHQALNELETNGSALHASTVNRFRMANRLHVAVSGLQCVPQEDDLLKVLQEILESIGDQSGAERGGSASRRILRYIVQTEADEPNLIQPRAAVVLATDQLKSVKVSIAKQTEKANEKHEFEYKQRKDELQIIEMKVDRLRKDLEDQASEAKSMIENGLARSQFETLEAKYLSKEVEYARTVEEFKEKQKDLAALYDQLFRLNRAPPTHLECKQLRQNLDLIVPFIESATSDEKSSRPFFNLLYNAQCVAIESALLLDRKSLTENDLKLLDCCADSLPSQCLEIREKWGEMVGNEKSLNPINSQEIRERVFSRYQLGFELAVRWFTDKNAEPLKKELKEERLSKALNVIAQNTNRSFVDFGKGKGDLTNNLFEDFPNDFLAYFSGSESLHVFWRIGGQEIQHEESSVDRKTLDRAIEVLLRLYRNEDLSSTDPDLQLQNRQLSGWLLPKSLCDELHLVISQKEIPCVYVAPHGPIFRIPLEGLNLLGVETPARNQESDIRTAVLGERLPLIYLPTLEKLNRSKKPAEMPVRGRVLSIKPNDNAGLESEDVLKLGDKDLSVPLTKEMKFKPADVVQCLRNPVGWEIVHFGCHAEADEASDKSDDNGSVADSDISLVKSGQTPGTTNKRGASIELIDPEKLTTNDLLMEFPPGSPLKINHVFLSACESNTTKVNDLKTGGNTFKTLCTTFLAIGAEDVIASHWKVDDYSTQELFVDIARQYKQHSVKSPANPPSTEEVAKMLFEARKRVRALGKDNPKVQDWSLPYYWNAFTIWTVR